MANPEHVALVKGGARGLAEWRQANPDQVLDLQKANLTAAKLEGMRLGPAKLNWAELSRADLTDTILDDSQLVGATLKRAVLIGTSFKNADLTGANLSGATVARVDLTGAKATAIRIERLYESEGPFDWLLFGLIALLSLFAAGTLAFSAYQGVKTLDDARTLITVVFTVGTVVIALALFASRWMTRSEDASERFQQSKEILTVLVGIVGTIIGWYFGQQSAGPVENGPALTGVQVSPSVVGPGEEAVLAAYVQRGTPPYEYSVLADGRAIGAGTSQSRMIVHRFKADAAQSEQKVPLRIGVADANRPGTVVYADGGELTIRPKQQEQKESLQAQN